MRLVCEIKESSTLKGGFCGVVKESDNAYPICVRMSTSCLEQTYDKDTKQDLDVGFDWSPEPGYVKFVLVFDDELDLQQIVKEKAIPNCYQCEIHNVEQFSTQAKFCMWIRYLDEAITN